MKVSEILLIIYEVYYASLHFMQSNCASYRIVAAACCIILIYIATTTATTV